MGNYTPTDTELKRLKEIFTHVKAENDSDLRGDSFQDLFVETDEYFETQTAGKSIVVGRKGSGKTALIYGFAKNNRDTYLNISSIDADEIPLVALYNYYLKANITTSIEIKEKSGQIDPSGGFEEVASFLDPTRLSTFAWQRAFQNFALFLAAEKVLAEGELNKEEEAVLSSITQGIKGQFDDTDATAFLYALLTENYYDIRELIEETIGSFVGTAWGKLVGLITNKIITRFRAAPPEDYKKALLIVKHRMSQNDWRTLITFDRFDDFYDKHYQDLQHHNEDLEESNLARRQILTAVLEGLILGVSFIKSNDDFEWLDLLVTIPMDKFMELNLRERARIETKNTIPLHWTPLELFDYANRRLAEALGERIPPNIVPWYFLFPSTVENNSIKGAKEDSFLYLLRHSLWKPREVQMYIQALLDRLFSGGHNFDERERIFQQTIQEQSKKIIQKEFEPEFKKQYPRLWNLFSQLKASRIETVMKLSDLMDSLSSNGLSSEVTKKREVLRRLYLMGVVGVRRVLPSKQTGDDATITQNRQEVCYMYSFSSTDRDPFAESCDVCFHPLFFDELGAEHIAPYIVNELRWEMFPAISKHLRFHPNR